MNRRNQILSALLLVQVVIGVVIFWPKPATAGEAPVFPDQAPEDVVALTIEDGEGDQTTLRRTEDGWVLPEAGDYPAQGDRVTPVLEDLLSLSTGRLITRNPVSHRQLQVAEDEFVRRIELTWADEATETFYLGSSPSYGATHFRLAGEDETYLTDEVSVWDIKATSSTWVDTTYLSVPQEELTQVTLENAHGTMTFVKNEEGRWAITKVGPGEEPNVSQASALVNKASRVTLARPLGREEEPDYGFDDPNAVVTLETEEETITLLVGAQIPDVGYVVKASTSPYYVSVAEMAVNALIDKDPQAFIQQPATPTPAPDA
jgi:hypothetical protein